MALRGHLSAPKGHSLGGPKKTEGGSPRGLQMWASFPEGLLGQVDVGKSKPPSTSLAHSL